jgi:peroxiredoxin Q/BCP
MRIGDLAPDFELPDQHGMSRRLMEWLHEGPVVLFFYPAALTYGCTKESCHFRDLAKEFAEFSAQRVGISRDGVGKQQEFADKNAFDYPLLSDPHGDVAKLFGVRRSLGSLPLGALATKRATFVIGTNRRILDVIKSEVRMGTHADQALAILRQRAAAR